MASTTRLRELAGLFGRLGVTAFGGPAGGRGLFYPASRDHYGGDCVGLPAIWAFTGGDGLYL